MSPTTAIRPTLTTRELCAATGATEREIQYWQETGLLQCVKESLSSYGCITRKVFPRTELPLARLAKRLGRFPSGRRRVVAAIRRAQMIPPYFVVFDKSGRRVRFAACGLDVVDIAIAAKSGVLVCEVKA